MNNHPNNLRDCSFSENALNAYCNQSDTKTNGVSSYAGNRFRAYITIDTKHKHIGVFDTKEEAVKARDKYILDNNLQHRYKLNYEKTLKHIDP